MIMRSPSSPYSLEFSSSGILILHTRSVRRRRRKEGKESDAQALRESSQGKKRQPDPSLASLSSRAPGSRESSLDTQLEHH
jgi:hypothetical protein